MKVLLAVGNSKVEDILIEKCKHANYEVVGVVTTKEAALENVKSKRPDVIILNESLSVQDKKLTCLSLIEDIRSLNDCNCRIILMACQHELKDEFLTAVVSKGVYDIIVGRISMTDVVSLLHHPNSYADAAKFRADSKNNEYKAEDYQVFDEEYVDTKKSLFQKISEMKKKPVNNQTGATQQNVQPVQQQEPIQQPQYQPQNFVQQQSQVQQPQFSQPSQTQQQVQFQPQQQSQFQQYVQQPMQTVQPEPEQEPQEQQTSVLVQPPMVQTNQAQSSGDVGNTTLLSQEPVGILFTPYGDNLPSANVLYSAMQPQKHVCKVIAFAASRQGVGVSTVALNTAYSLAYSGKKVMLIECNYIFRSSLEKRLNVIPHIHFDDVCAQGVTQNVAAYSFYKNNAPENRRKFFPETLQFFTCSGEKRKDKIPEFNIETNIDIMKEEFDYIICDTYIGFGDPITKSVINKADKVYLVCTQDLFDLSTQKDGLYVFNNIVPCVNKTGVLINKYVKCSPNLKDIGTFFGTEDIFYIPDDSKNFISATAEGFPYYLMGKKAIKRAFDTLGNFL